MARKVSFLGIMTALACIMSYIEFLIPFSVGIYGVKLGLANLVILCLLYRQGVKEAFMVSVVRVFLVSMLFANMAVFLYSAAGAGFSLFIMWVAKKSRRLSLIMVSILGGICHNIAQLAVAVFLVEHIILWNYLPVLLISGIITGGVIGYLADKIKRALK